MQIRAIFNGGLVEVDDEYAAELIATGEYEPADKPTRKRAATKTKTAPVEEPKTEE